MYQAKLQLIQQQFLRSFEAAKSLRIWGLYEESEAESSNDEEASKEPNIEMLALMTRQFPSFRNL